MVRGKSEQPRATAAHRQAPDLPSHPILDLEEDCNDTRPLAPVLKRIRAGFGALLRLFWSIILVVQLLVVGVLGKQAIARRRRGIQTPSSHPVVLDERHNSGIDMASIRAVHASATFGRDTYPAMSQPQLPPGTSATELVESLRSARAPGSGGARRVCLTGRWRKDHHASQKEEYFRALELMKVTGLRRQASRLLKGIDIRHTTDNFNMFFITPIPAFKVAEKYLFDGTVTLRRRDMRPGGMTATAFETCDDGSVVLDIQWGEPHPGRLVDRIYCPEEDVMHVDSFIQAGKEQQMVRQVYRKD